MNSNEVAVIEDNIDMVIRICEAAARIKDDGRIFKAPETISLGEGKELHIRKMGQLFRVEVTTGNHTQKHHY